jgi:hypothetical protein
MSKSFFLETTESKLSVYKHDIEGNYIRIHFEIKLSRPRNRTVIVNDIL